MDEKLNHWYVFLSAPTYLHPLPVGVVRVLAATVASLIAAIATPYSLISHKLRPKKYRPSECWMFIRNVIKVKKDGSMRERCTGLLDRKVVMNVSSSTAIPEESFPSKA